MKQGWRLPKSEIGAGLRKSLHVPEVAAGDALHVREGFPEVARQPIHDARAPALLRLPLQDLRADPVVEPHPLLVHGEHGLGTRPLDLDFRDDSQRA